MPNELHLDCWIEWHLPVSGKLLYITPLCQGNNAKKLIIKLNRTIKSYDFKAHAVRRR